MTRRNCPYALCSRIVIVTPTVPPTFGIAGGESDERDLIHKHDIENPLLDGPCPASLMYYPLDTQAASHLAKRLFSDTARMEVAKRYFEAKDEAPFKPSDNRSQSLRGPHRMGREPEPDSREWALGGRKDEDVQKHDPNELATPIPDYVEGHAEGKYGPTTIWSGSVNTNGGTGMASIPELTAAAQAAIAKTQEAFAQAERAKVLSAEARLAWQAIIQDSGAQTASNAHHAMVGAVSEIEASMGAMNDSVEQAEQFLANLHA